jgi:predicted O-methyltransferase YrrM
MSPEAVEDFYKTTRTNLNQYTLEHIIEWHKEDFKVASKYEYDPIIIPEIDFLLLDGGAFSGRADFMRWFPRVKEGGIIALDDTNDIKNYGNYQWLKTAGHGLLWEEQSWRNGSAIFRK